MPKHTQTVQPYEYGHPFSKNTRLWLKNLPKLKPTNILDEYEPTYTAKWFNSGAGWKGNHGKIRSRFWEGIAKAMVNQWG